jgi:hypothetical protein
MNISCAVESRIPEKQETSQLGEVVFIGLPTSNHLVDINTTEGGL